MYQNLKEAIMKTLEEVRKAVEEKFLQFYFEDEKV